MFIYFFNIKIGPFARFLVTFVWNTFFHSFTLRWCLSLVVRYCFLDEAERWILFSNSMFFFLNWGIDTIELKNKQYLLIHVILWFVWVFSSLLAKCSGIISGGLLCVINVFSVELNWWTELFKFVFVMKLFLSLLILTDNLAGCIGWPGIPRAYRTSVQAFPAYLICDLVFFFFFHVLKSFLCFVHLMFYMGSFFSGPVSLVFCISIDRHLSLDWRHFLLWFCSKYFPWLWLWFFSFFYSYYS